MAIEDTLVLSNEPLPEMGTTITFELFETITRGDLPQKKALEGKITCNLNQCPIFSLPEGTTHPFLRRDRSKWDLYLVLLPFTLHQAPEGGYYEEVTLFITLQDQNSSALDLFPKAITTPGDTTGIYTLAFEPPNAATAHSQPSNRQIHFPVRPTITASGEGEGTFYWRFKASGGQKEVVPETKHALLILQVPRGTESIVGMVSYEMTVVKQQGRVSGSVESESDQLPIRWDLRDAPDFFGKPSTPSLKSNAVHLAFDICVLCALREEGQAFQAMAERFYDLHFQQAYSEQIGRDYLYATMLNTEGEPLLVHLSWLPAYGPEEVALHFKPVLNECRPRFAAMTGICAGDKRKVKLGDVVIADRAFLYDTGKFVLDEDGQRVHLANTNTRSIDPGVLQFAQMFEYWKYANPPLERSLQDPSRPVFHIKPMASGNAVRSDNPFDEVRIPVRDTVAIDMEGATFYRTVADFPGLRSLLVKGVCDYADSDKNDAYHAYAAQMSALYMLAFLKEYGTERRLPRRF